MKPAPWLLLAPIQKVICHTYICNGAAAACMHACPCPCRTQSMSINLALPCPDRCHPNTYNVGMLEAVHVGCGRGGLEAILVAELVLLTHVDTWIA